MSPLLSLISLQGKERGGDASPKIHPDSALECEASPVSLTRQRPRPKAKDYYDRASVHSLHRVYVTSAVYYLQAKSELFPASFPAQWHDPRLAVHHQVDAEGEGKAGPNSGTCLLLLAVPLLPWVHPQHGYHLLDTELIFREAVSANRPPTQGSPVDPGGGIGQEPPHLSLCLLFSLSTLLTMHHD